MTSQLNLKTLKCIRQHDLTGKDEPEIWINGRKYFATVLDKEGHVNVPPADSAI